MNSRVYKIAGKEVTVTDKNILEIIEKTETFEISPREADEKLQKYLLSDKSVSLSEYFKRMNLWEAIVTEWEVPCRGRLDSVHEMYVEKHGLSGRLTI
jgi:hypothetical protein